MKLQIDTLEKTIKCEEMVILDELIKELDLLLPDKWRGYRLITTTIIYSSPTIFPAYPNPYPVWPLQPTYEHYKVTC
jgi:hypothetical protein